MAMTSLSIVLTVFVLQLHHVGPHQKPVPNWIRKVVIDYIAKILCMRSHLASYYGYDYKDYKERMTVGTTTTCNRREEMCLTSFMDNVDYKESNNCNGRLNQSPLHLPGERTVFERDGTGGKTKAKGGIKFDRISKHLKILVSKHDSEDEYQDVINEWRLVAHIMDRFLFWLFLIGSLLSSVTILVFRPMAKPTTYNHGSSP